MNLPEFKQFINNVVDTADVQLNLLQQTLNFIRQESNALEEKPSQGCDYPFPVDLFSYETYFRLYPDVQQECFRVYPNATELQQFNFALSHYISNGIQEKRQFPLKQDSVPTPANLQIGNFLGDNIAWTSMTLMSDYLHNGNSADRAASDSLRQTIIDKAKTYGNTFHIYGTNDDNYSRRRGNSNGWWDHIPDRRLFYKVEDKAHWVHWLHMVRDAEMEIVMWLWPNDARNTYNKSSEWSNSRIVSQMKLLIDLGREGYRNKGKLIKDYVLKLEADDEWSVHKINSIAAEVKAYLKEDEKLWYHNQTNDLHLLSQIDWNLFNGFRWQWMGAQHMDDTQFQNVMLNAMSHLPQHLLWVGGEWAPGMNSEVEQLRRGDLILDLAKANPRIVGVDNGATSFFSGSVQEPKPPVGELTHTSNALSYSSIPIDKIDFIGRPGGKDVANYPETAQLNIADVYKNGKDWMIRYPNAKGFERWLPYPVFGPEKPLHGRQYILVPQGVDGVGGTVGRWYCAFFEWFIHRPSINNQHYVGNLNIVHTNILEGSPLENWKPHRGQTYGVMIGTVVEASTKSRSNIKTFVWP